MEFLKRTSFHAPVHRFVDKSIMYDITSNEHFSTVKNKRDFFCLKKKHI